MNHIIAQRNWLYLLTALILLMQSFSIWHDASHPFHVSDVECERFESISHTPSIDLTRSIHPQFTAYSSLVTPTLPITYIVKHLDNNYIIRGPPIFS